MRADRRPELVVAAEVRADVAVLTVTGSLTNTTYLPLRDAVIKAALDEPRAVIADVSELVVPVPSAWVVFTSARWHIDQWLDVPLALVCLDPRGREELGRLGVVRYLPVFCSAPEAIYALDGWQDRPLRRRARTELPAVPSSAKRSRDFVEEWLTAWSHSELISVAKLIVTIFVENVLSHTESAPVVRVECTGDLVTVAVEDGSSAPAVRRERPDRGPQDVAGLAIVAALCKKWGNLPTPAGKTVWAAIGPENQL